MSHSTNYERHETIGIITIDNPPVNALGLGVRQGLLDGLAKASQDDQVQAVVIIGGGRTFPAGADIKEFDKHLAAPDLNTVINALEANTKPVIAAIHGTALGGGLEIALGCHFRCAAPTARVGLPEVTLGILPGAGGTQRLPRLIGAKDALDMIVSGQFIKAPKALNLGILDQIVEGDLLTGALALAKTVVNENRPLQKARDRDVSADPVLFEDMRQSIARRSRGFLAPFRCIDAIEIATTTPFDEGMKKEREFFTELVNSTQSAGQRHYFFAERTVAKIPDVPKDTPVRSIETVAIIGAGTMGGGIAMNFANAGLPVTLLDANQEGLDKGLGVIRKNYENSAKKGRMTSANVDTCMGLITGTLDYDALAGVDMVIEAVFEDMDLKCNIFTKLDAVCKLGAILATNTSTLDINEIAAVTQRPEDVIGSHFFSPANVMRLLEFVRGAKTSKEVIATTMKLSKTINKVGVLVGVCDGFVGNRMLNRYFIQTEQMIEEGALPAQIDKALFDFGLAMGPFAMGDMAGNDVNWLIRKRRFTEQQRQIKEYSGTVADRICELGRYGQKTGGGWYDYSAGSRTPQPSKQVEEVILKVSQEKGITRRQISDQEILKRTLYALVNEGAKILEEGVALRASDIDVIYITGYGFPVYRGGPMFYADQIGLDKVYADIVDFQDRIGDEWEPAPLIKRLAEEGKGFSDI